MKQKVVKFLTRLLFFFPSKLPSGLTEFQQFVTSMKFAYNLPDNDSFTWIIAYQLMHFDRAKDYKLFQLLLGDAYCSKRRIYLAIRGGESRQTAGEAFRMIKEKQLAATKSAPVDTTPSSSVVSANG